MLNSYDLVNNTDTHYTLLSEYERFNNYTFNPPSNKSQLYATKNIIKEELYYEYIVTQIIVFQHFRGANLASTAVNQKGKFYRPVADLLTRGWKPQPGERYYFPEPNKYHSLTIYKKVVVGFSYHLEFGHFISDCLAGIISVPSEIIEGAEIFVRTKLIGAVKTYCKLLGFNPEHFNPIPNDWIYCNDLYIVESERGLNALPVAWKDLHDHIYRKNNLSEVDAVNHIFINKFPNEWGHISNIMELYNYSIAKYPEYNWVLLDPKLIYDIVRASKIIASGKIIFISSGSCSFNSIFAKPKSGIYIMSQTTIDYAAITCSYSLNLYVFAVGTTTIVIRKLGGTFPLELFNKTLPYMLSAVYKSVWPKDFNQIATRFVNIENVYKNYYKFYGNKTNIMHYTINTIQSVTPYCSKFFKECSN